jgi:hypothetical protein
MMRPPTSSVRCSPSSSLLRLGEAIIKERRVIGGRWRALPVIAAPTALQVSDRKAARSPQFARSRPRS